ncbi:MAG: DNA repair protein RadC [Thermodesulfobacteriota bacterium]|nr:DNA repair protein RadC [Thermodesulfobacteriota bacterium]
MKKISEIPVQERPREKLLAKGAQSLADDELLAVLLGRGTRKKDVLALSRQLIKIVDRRGMGLQAEDVMELEGIGAARAALVMAAFEFVRRRIRPEGMKIQSPPDVLPLIHHYRDRKQEHFLSISLNGANEVMNVRVITIGLINKSHVHPREVFADVIAERASAVILAHNHPSGDLTPSQQDRAVTKQLREAGRILGIDVLDHIIFSNKGYYSFMEHRAGNYPGDG